MGTPISTTAYRHRRDDIRTSERGFERRPTDRAGIRAADRLRAALFLRRVGRRLERRPDQTLDDAFAIEWRTDPQIAIASVACALEALQMADETIAAQADASAEDARAGSDPQDALRLAAEFLRAQAETQAGTRTRPPVNLWRSAMIAPAPTAPPTAVAPPPDSPREERTPISIAARRHPVMERDMDKDPSPDIPEAMHVLVVDDDPDIRRMLRILLEEEGHQVRAAHDGQHALEQISHHQPDLVLLDLQMPRMTGWELQDELVRRQVQVPVVFMTAGDRARAEAEHHRVAGYLAKPFNLDDLLDTIARIRSLPTRAS